MLKVGIIGCGKITEVRHAPEYFNNPDSEIVTWFDPVRERAETLAGKYGGKVCGSLEELLAEDLDAVSVCVRNDGHYGVSMAALEAGKHVLCEKPMAMKPEDCMAMVQKAKEKGLNLMIGLNQRLMKAHVKAREMIAAGEIGKVLTFETHFCHPGPEAWTGEKNPWFFDKSKSAFGAMADLGVHKTDLLYYLIGQKFTETTAVLGTIDKKFADGKPIEVEDNAFCIYRTENGALGTMDVSWTNYGKEAHGTIIKGTKGILKLYADEEYSLVLERSTGEVERYQLDRVVSNEEQTSGGYENTGVIDEFVDSIKNHRVPVADGESALHAMMVIFANAESSKLGKTVKVEL